MEALHIVTGIFIFVLTVLVISKYDSPKATANIS